MSIKRPLTIKQKKYVAGITSGKPGYKAALEAYDTTDPNTANQISIENLQKPTIKDALRPFLEKHNITIDRALAPISKGLSAHKVNEYTGEVTEDIGLQMKASDRALKLLGVTSDPSNTLHLHLHDQGKTYNL